MRSKLNLLPFLSFILLGCAGQTNVELATPGVDGWEATNSGLKYRILEPGPGEKPTEADKVKVHYKGWLPDRRDPSTGKVFDSSYERGEPTSFRLNEVIPGWTEGVQLVGEGGKLELEVPSGLAYGARGTPDGAIPPGATLRFIIELLEIVQPPKQGPTDADAPTEFTETDSGLKYRILRKGDGTKPTADSTVTVHYRGWLPAAADPAKGLEFDSSYAGGEPISFPLRGVIPGWTEGLQFVSPGGMIELEVPSQLGYGPRGMGTIPPNATLRFIVELLEVR